MAEEDEIESRPGRARGRGGFLSGLVAKVKRLPTPYLVAGLGGGALHVDYLVEGDSSIASSLYRGIFGGRGERYEGRRLPMEAGVARQAPIITRPTMVPAPAPGLDYYVVPVPYYQPGGYWPAHRPYRPYARVLRSHGFHPGWGHVPHAAPHGFWGGRHHAGFDWEE